MKYKNVIKKVIYLCFVYVLCHNILLCQNNKYRYINNEAFGFGEKLEYKVGLIGGVFDGLGGKGGLKIGSKPVIREGRECYDIQFWVNSEGVVDFTYPVHDKYRSIVDVSGIFPFEFYQQIREGKYKKDFKATFDQSKHLAIVKDKQYPIEEYMLDLVSAFYYVRTMDLSKMPNGHIFYLKNFYKDTTFSLPVKIIKRETIKVPAGKFNTIVVQPIIAAGGLFKFQSHIYIWLTNDDRKMPVKVSTTIVIGEAGAELIKYSGVRGKINAKLD